jgi:hypothetical protein
MNPDIDKVIEAWRVLAEEIKKFPPKIDNPNYSAFSIYFINGEYILNVDIDVFEQIKEKK